MTCSNEMSHISKKIELVTPMERIFIELCNSAKIMELALAQPKLFDTCNVYNIMVFSRNQVC